MDKIDPMYGVVNEPFGGGRSAFRLLFDFGSMLSCFNGELPNRRVLDFCAGSGWISEWLNRLHYDVYAIDTNADVGNVMRRRAEIDSRLDPDHFTFSQADGHNLPFADEFFGHICCFDSLHHMHDYSKALQEIFRVLASGGRAIFVEPGAKHATSKETIDFINKYRKDDPTWIERDVVLDDIFVIASDCGFSSLIVRPLLLPDLREYDFLTWKKFRAGNRNLEIDYLDMLKCVNYEYHLVFYLEKGGPGLGIKGSTPPQTPLPGWLIRIAKKVLPSRLRRYGKRLSLFIMR